MNDRFPRREFIQRGTLVVGVGLAWPLLRYGLLGAEVVPAADAPPAAAKSLLAGAPKEFAPKPRPLNPPPISKARPDLVSMPVPAADPTPCTQYPHTGEPPIPPVGELFNFGIRDTAVCAGPDRTYYLTGTIGPDFMVANEGIRVWKSKDLKKWEPLGLVWSIEKDGTWQKIWTPQTNEFGMRRAVWAPEIHYINGTFYIPYCITGLGTGILKSTTGQAGGPYVSVIKPDAPLTGGIDASLFQDDDGKVYFIHANGNIARLKDDFSDLAQPLQELRCEVPDLDPKHHHPGRPGKPADYDRVGWEGVFLFKANGRYYLSAAERYYERYHCMTAESDKLMGPYKARYVSVPYAGHNTFFKDSDGNWWSTMFGNDAQAPVQKKPAILRVEFAENGRIRPFIPPGTKPYVPPGIDTEQFSGGAK